MILCGDKRGDTHAAARVLRYVNCVGNELGLYVGLCGAHFSGFPLNAREQGDRTRITCLDCAAEMARLCFYRDDRGQL